MDPDMPRIDFLADDWANGNVYLAHVIGSMALQHRDLSSSYPHGLSHEEWQDILTRIGEPLMAYAAGLDDPRSATQLKADAKKALALLAQWFDQLWD